MIKGFDRKWIVLFALSLIYIFMVQSINFVAGEYGFSIMLPAIFIVPAALFMNAGAGIILIVLLGFIESAFYPVRMGLVSIIWALLALPVSLSSFRYRNLGFFSIVCLLEIVNFLAILAYCVIFSRGMESFSEYFLRVFFDAAISGVVLAVIGYYSILIPRSISYFLGENLSIQDVQ